MKKKVWVVAPGLEYEGILEDWLRVFRSEEDARAYVAELAEDGIGDEGFTLFQVQELF